MTSEVARAQAASRSLEYSGTKPSRRPQQHWAVGSFRRAAGVAIGGLTIAVLTIVLMCATRVFDGDWMVLVTVCVLLGSNVIFCIYGAACIVIPDLMASWLRRQIRWPSAWLYACIVRPIYLGWWNAVVYWRWLHAEGDEAPWGLGYMLLLGIIPPVLGTIITTVSVLRVRSE